MYIFAKAEETLKVSYSTSKITNDILQQLEHRKILEIIITDENSS